MNTPSYRRARQRQKGRAAAGYLAGLVAAVLVGILLYALLYRPPIPSQLGLPVPMKVLKNLTTIPTARWRAIGIVGAPKPEAISKVSTPTFLYMGAEGCPYCAAEDWAVTIALDRFGKLTGITLMRSAARDYAPDTATVSYLHAVYRSPYLRAHLVELAGRQLVDGQFAPPLEQPTANELAEMNSYDHDGSIPFVVVGGRYLWIGAPFNPLWLRGQSWLTISREIRSAKGVVARSVLSTANALAAAICSVDGEQPAPVCHVSDQIATG